MLNLKGQTYFYILTTENKMETQEIMAAYQKGFLGAVNDNVVAIAFDYDEGNLFTYVYLKTIPTDEDFEIVDIAVTETIAHLPKITYEKIYLEKKCQGFRMREHQGWFFMRYSKSSLWLS
ncbi:hypothetical protein [Bernardetia sp.]|uniref:hypothetical protein n=1 Tax=Bernardetia sp. TaxID=1937974 RepID=UPI0025C42AA2|nr:hypothetical protein [Bernardetia sp.]